MKISSDRGIMYVTFGTFKLRLRKGVSEYGKCSETHRRADQWRRRPRHERRHPCGGADGNEEQHRVRGHPPGLGGPYRRGYLSHEFRQRQPHHQPGRHHLYTARSDEFRTPEGQKKAANTCKLLGLDGIVAIGGDGTFRGAQDLSRFGVSVVGVPGTIDNDIVCTDYTIGFDTAANTAVECIDRLRDTMQSHERCSVVEVMGRHAGYLALYVGVAVGATAVLVPEHQYDFEKHVAEKIRAARLGGKTNFMIVVAEGAASAMDVGKEIKEHLGLDPRVTILGHIQRGGSPTAKDRVLATRMGYEAVRVLAEGMTNRVICVRDDQIVNVDIDEGLAMKKTLNAEEFEVMTVMTGV